MDSKVENEDATAAVNVELSTSSSPTSVEGEEMETTEESGPDDPGTCQNDANHNTGDEVSATPTFSSIAKSLKRAATTGRPLQGDGDEDGLEDEEIQHRMKFERILKLNLKKKDVERDRKEGVVVKKSLAQIKRELVKTLRLYFKSAFTIIVKKRRLCPSDAFELVKVFGINVPKFAHPALLEYVEEVSRKLILLLIRNISEGCVLHVMIEKNKTLHVVQRFVFRTLGSVEFANFLRKSSENSISDEFDLDEVRMQCRTSLLEILNSDTIQPILLPQFSRWSISLGLKDEFVSLDREWAEQLWYNDPNGNYFPWKVRPRNSPNDDIVTTGETEVPNPPVAETPTTDDKDNETNAGVSESADHRLTAVTADPLNGKSLDSTVGKIVTEDNEEEKQLSGIICSPLSSFPITPDLMISIYGLEYPAPDPPATPKHYQESGFSRGSRTPNLFRLSQRSHRMFSKRPRDKWPRTGSGTEDPGCSSMDLQ